MKTISPFLSCRAAALSRAAHVAFLSFILVFAGCSSDDDPAPDPTEPAVEASLSVTPESIAAANAAGTYALAVTSNVAWTAAVDAVDTWCTLEGAPVTGNGNGAVTVSVTENAATVTRNTTITFTAGTLTQQVAVAQVAAGVPPPDDATPPLAASTRTWTFGNQTWSDDIEISDCIKDATGFANSTTNPQCRTYTSDTNTWYYYNWPYMNANKATMCPDPWHVPTKDDFETLKDVAGEVGLDWSLGGHCYYQDSGIGGVSLEAYWWATDEASDTYAYALKYWSDETTPIYFRVDGGNNKAAGFHVRCVK